MIALLVLLGVPLLGACGAAGTDRDGAGSTPDDTTRVIHHATGDTTITGRPQRVVVLDTGELDSVLALGVTPVAAVRADATSGLPSYLAGRASDVAVAGTIGEPDLEAIAALQPDLILSNKVRHEDLYDRLSGIAPTVFAEKVGVAWQENFRLAAEALGQQAKAQRILAEYADKAKRTGQAFGDPAALQVSMVRFLPGSIRLYGQGSFIGTILADAGFARPPAQRVDKTFVEVSPEQLGQANGDLLFYAAYGSTGKAEQDQLTAGPLWQRLSAVSGGRAHEVSDDLWYVGIGPIAADLVLDDLQWYAGT
jgi:iron complex transport system substrate-binding protein